MEIKSYSFGRINVDGKDYQEDLIVFPDKVRAHWWRREGHTLLPGDLEAVVEYKPEILVVGQGASGVMSVPKETSDFLASKGINVVAATTDKACKIFNQYLSEGKNVVGAFHLTC